MSSPIQNQRDLVAFAKEICEAGGIAVIYFDNHQLALRSISTSRDWSGLFEGEVVDDSIVRIDFTKISAVRRLAEPA